MIGLPDGADGLRDQRALLPLARARAEQVPDAAAEVGAAQQHIGGEGHQRDARHKLGGAEVGHHTGSSSVAFGLLSTCW